MSANLTQIHAARPLTGANTAKGDLYYVTDVSETTASNKDKAHNRDEMLRAMAESARVGASKYVIPFLPQVVGLTGGGATKLDGVLDGLAVTDIQAPFAVDLSMADDDQRWKLRAKGGGEVEDGVAFVSPDNAAFTSYIWVRIR